MENSKKHNIKKYIKLTPLILYPYAYLAVILLFISTGLLISIINIQPSSIVYNLGFYLVIGIVIIYNVYTVFIAIHNAKESTKESSSAYDVAKTNFIVKSAQIPAYIFHFIIGMLSMVMSVWGIGLLLAVIIVDTLTIMLTGIHSIGCTIKMKRANLISSKKAVICGICGFIYLADIIVAFYYIVLTKKSKTLEDTAEV